MTNIRGPRERVQFGGFQVTAAIPITAAENGNITAHFVVLSYADDLTISIIVDSDHFGDLGLLAEALTAGLGAFTGQFLDP